MIKGFLNKWKTGFSEICAESNKNSYGEVSLFHVSPAPVPIQSLSCSRPCQNKVWADLPPSLQQNQNHITPRALAMLWVYMQDCDGQKQGH